MSLKIHIESISYQDSRDKKILSACLKSWFKDPKDLNLTDPRMSYPFNFRKWVNTSYRYRKTQTFVLKADRQIIGYVSILIDLHNSLIHLFHLFITREHRRKGYGKKLFDQVESIAQNHNVNKITLHVVPGNKGAINLYESLGFRKIGMTLNDNIKMAKQLD